MCAEAAGFTVHVEVLRANEPTAQIMIATMTNSKRAKRERERETHIEKERDTERSVTRAKRGTHVDDRLSQVKSEAIRKVNIKANEGARTRV